MNDTLASKAHQSGAAAAARILSGEWATEAHLRALWTEDGFLPQYRAGFDSVWLPAQ